MSDEQVIQRLTELLREHGRLTHDMIRSDMALPCISVISRRFGSAGVAIGLAGHHSERRPKQLQRFRRGRAIRTHQTGLLRLVLAENGFATIPDGEARFSLNGVAVVVVAATMTLQQGRYVQWRGNIPPSWSELLVVCRMSDTSDFPLDYRVVDRTKLKLDIVRIAPRPSDRLGPVLTTIEDVAERVDAMARPHILAAS
jgi:hypothetical protein